MNDNLVESIRSACRLPVETYSVDVDATRMESILASDRIGIDDFLALLSDQALPYQEPLACKASELTRRHFGNAVVIFTPLYISNFCENRCPYCSFASHQKVQRRQLDAGQIRDETRRIAATGIRHILVLTGESRSKASFSYISESIGIIAGCFSSIGIEMYPMTAEEYGGLAKRGVDALTIYQEVYDEEKYRVLHEGGPKQDYRFRLEAADRACRQGFRSVTIGALLGLNSMVREMYALALHARYLQDTFPDVEIGLSFPRIRPLVSDFPIPFQVAERKLAQIIIAFRILFPHAVITLSTRESPKFRDGAVRLGVAKMSAGVSTAVGGHGHDEAVGQFEIADARSVDEVCNGLLSSGLQPVMHDWNHNLVR